MKLTYKKGRGDKLHIRLDDEYRLTVDEGYFLCLGYKNGCEITDEEYEVLEKKINFRRAYNCAAELLSRRDHSERELLNKLREKGFSKGSREALEKLKNDGYIDDRRFAASFCAELIRLKHYGKRRIEQELYKKGISREVINEVLSEAEFEEDALGELIRRKYLSKTADEKGRHRVVNSLLRLGYSYSEIKDAMSLFCESDLAEEVFDE